MAATFNAEPLPAASASKGASRPAAASVGGSAPIGGVAADGALGAHEAALDPHPQYETASEVNAKVVAHTASPDPHGDRAYADGKFLPRLISTTKRLLGLNGVAPGAAEELTLSTVLDWIGSAARGDLLFRGASGWSRLPAGTAGQVLQTGGSAGDPLWATPSGGGAGPVTPDSAPVVAAPADDEFQAGSALDTAGARRVGALPWSWVNQGSATAVVDRGHLIMTAPPIATLQLRCVTQAVSGASWKYRAKLSALDGWSTNFYMVGMVLRNAANSRLFSFHKVYSNGLRLEGNRWTLPTIFSSTSLPTTDVFTDTAIGRSFRQPLYFEMELISGIVNCRYSDVGADGTFITLGQESVAAFLGSVTEVGLLVNSNYQVGGITTPVWGAWDWFRRVS